MTFETIGETRIYLADCLDLLRSLADNSIDAIVTDPPYGLTSKRNGRSEATKGAVMKGFMGLEWDGNIPSVEIWKEHLRVLKPGGHLLAFAGTRTQHRMACNIEDAGFEIRDMIAWLYGSGFPKSHNLDGKHEGWGTALKPAIEPITFARKPIIGTVSQNMQAHGVGAINIDKCRVASSGERLGGGDCNSDTGANFKDGWRRPWMDDPEAMKAHAEKVRKNVEKSESLGRWPANVIHDGSDEVVTLFPGKKDNSSVGRFFYCPKANRTDRNEGCENIPNCHPTVKPTDLMRYLIRLVTPSGGLVGDFFMGSGSTGKAAVLENVRFIGCDKEANYFTIAKTRIQTALNPSEITMDDPAF